MKLRKMIQTAVLGGALLGMVGAANATDYEINIYGASAQLLYWTSAAEGFLKTTGTGNPGCTSVTNHVNTAGTDGISFCTNSSGNTYTIRYSSKNSLDGIRAVQSNDDGGVGSAKGCSAGSRWMMSAYNASTSAESYACEDITIGASDVEAATFRQATTGHQYGPYTGGTNTSKTFTASGVTISTSSYTKYSPLVVPFAFFANEGVPFDNMTRLMAVTLFAGQVSDWNQFDPTLSSVPVVLCMRHAGSGTLATLDAAVMRGDAALIDTENSASPNYVWFNDGSSYMMGCINGSTTTTSGYSSWTGAAGAVGYADSDQLSTTSAQTKYPDVKLMTYQGVDATKANIVNGQYDFWSYQELYEAKADDTATKSLVSKLMSYASNPDNLPSSKADYWAAGDEMFVGKYSDFEYPAFN